MWSPPLLPRTLDAALRDLGETSAKIRASACADLAQHHEGSGRDRVIRALLQALEDPEPEVRAEAARGLGLARAAEGLARLSVALEDPSPLVRQTAADSLGELGDPRAVERLRKLLADERPEMRFQAVISLPRHLDDEEAVGALALAAADEDAKVRYIALRVAEERWEEGPMPGRIRDEARARLGDREAHVQVAAALLLASQGDRAGRKVLVGVVEGAVSVHEPQDEAAAVEAVGQLGLEEARAALERRAFGVARLWRDQCSFHARVSLARLGDGRARGEILRDLGSWSRSRRIEAVLAAGKARLIEARPAIEAMRSRVDQAESSIIEGALLLLGGA
jgi:hypothetical protein